jgi:hypothetical protein
MLEILLRVYWKVIQVPYLRLIKLCLIILTKKESKIALQNFVKIFLTNVNVLARKSI